MSMQTVEVVIAGPQGIDGSSTKAGGTTGQVLTKLSNLDYQVDWTTLGSDTIVFSSNAGLSSTTVSTGLDELAGSVSTNTSNITSVNTIANDAKTASTSNTTSITNITDGIQSVKKVLLPYDYDITSVPKLTGNIQYDNVMDEVVFDYGNGNRLPISNFNFIKVENNSGSTITKGTIVRRVGVSNGVTQIAPANITSLSNANAIGIMYTTVLNGEFSIAVTKGLLEDIDTSSISTGADVYLGSAGSFSTTPGAIATKIGTVMSTASNGSILINIQALQELPILFGSLLDTSSSNEIYSLTTTPQNISNYNSTINSVLSSYVDTGVISVPTSGLFEITCYVEGEVSAEDSPIHIEIYNNTSLTSLFTYTVVAGKSVNTTAVPISNQVSRPIQLPSAADLLLRISSDSSITLTLSNLTFSVKSINADKY